MINDQLDRETFDKLDGDQSRQALR